MNSDNNNNPWGSGNGNSPWGKDHSNQDFENTIRKARDRFGKFNLGSRRNLMLFVLFALILWIASGLYRVEPDEQGVELLFGKWNGITTESGLHYFFPTPIGKTITPKVEIIRKINVGYRTGSDFGQMSTNAVRDVIEESLILTGDQNIADVDFTVLFKIKDAGNYLFKIKNPETTVKATAESVMREVVGQKKLQFLLTEGRQEVEQITRIRLQEIMDDYESGILIQSVQLQKVDPPVQVIDAFDEVQRARQDKTRLQNEAEAYLNKIVPTARGEAARLVQEAKAYKEQVEKKQLEQEIQIALNIQEQYLPQKLPTIPNLIMESLSKPARKIGGDYYDMTPRKS